MNRIDIEVRAGASRDYIRDCILDTARSIADGYGAGSIMLDTSDPVMAGFWSSIPKTLAPPHAIMISIRLDRDDLSDHEVAAAVEKVAQRFEDGPAPIVVFGLPIGHWTEDFDQP